MMPIDVRFLSAEDRYLLERTAPGVFDHPLDPRWTRSFLESPNHHLAVAVETETDLVVGMATAVVHLQPDKQAQLYVNELGVSPSRRREGIGRQLVSALLEQARRLGCREVWLATEPDNDAARQLYRSAGGKEEPAVLYNFELD